MAYLPQAGGPGAGLSRTMPDFAGQERAEIAPKPAPRSAARRRKPLKTRGLPKPLRTRAPRPAVRARRFPVHDAPLPLPLRTMRVRARRVKRTMVRGTIFGRRRGAVGQGLGRAGVSAPAGPPGAGAPGVPRKRFRGITSPRRRVAPDTADIAIAGQGARPPFSLLPPSRGRSGGRSQTVLGWVGPGRSPTGPPPPGQPPSRPPPFQGGGEKTAAVRLPVRPSRAVPNGGP